MNAEVRKYEVQSYSSTLKVLYASGSITWEHEALMTDLRLILHISNDEHLLALRQLASGYHVTRFHHLYIRLLRQTNDMVGSCV
ncbi:hypothetical protein ZOSMA_349G00030 [Zostera marina]|uniref:ENT domain-containing protein n=1 Tax=Zostera marina TaxID=29655 RepID=A0A0K9P9I8_ZOSMR|nr:hypothetical protein ZOSMA_349G00030 [Zostera marina]